MNWRAAHTVATCLAILAASLIWASLRGQDVNWDLQNYHLYDPFALLHGRLFADVAPAGPQSFLNPLPYFLPYALHRLLPPYPAGLATAALQSVALMLAFLLAQRLSPRPLAVLAATATAITGPVVLSELGTSFADLTLAIPPLASLLLLAAPTRSARRLLLAGLLTGIAIGIKPTSLFLLPSLAAYAALQQRQLSQAARSASLIIAGTVAGALLSNGPWALFLWRSYDSPMFPFLNTIFRSHAAALVDFSDPRFHFTTIRHALAIPFALATGTTVTGETPIRDARFAFALCTTLVFLAITSIRRKSSDDALIGLSAYFLLGLAAWLVLCPIERYAAVLEILCGLVSILIVDRLPGRNLAPVAALLLIATTQPAETFHRPWREATDPAVPTGVPTGAIYGLLAQPLGYWVATSPRPDHAFGLASTLLEPGGTLQRRLDTILRSNTAPLWLLDLDEPVDDQIRIEMSRHGIALAPPCLRTKSLYWIDTVFCRGIVTTPRTLAASDFAIGQTATFSTSGSGLIYELDGFGATEPAGTWALGHDALLAIHLDPATRAAGASLQLGLSGPGPAPTHTVTITADHGPPMNAALTAPGFAATPTVCIPPNPGGDSTALIHFHTDDIRSLAQLGLTPESRPLAFLLHDMTLRPEKGTPGCL